MRGPLSGRNCWSRCTQLAPQSIGENSVLAKSQSEVLGQGVDIMLPMEYSGSQCMCVCVWIEGS